MRARAWSVTMTGCCHAPSARRARVQHQRLAGHVQGHEHLAQVGRRGAADEGVCSMGRPGVVGSSSYRGGRGRGARVPVGPTRARPRTSRPPGSMRRTWPAWLPIQTGTRPLIAATPSPAAAAPPSDAGVRTTLSTWSLSAVVVPLCPPRPRPSKVRDGVRSQGWGLGRRTWPTTMPTAPACHAASASAAASSTATFLILEGRQAREVRRARRRAGRTELEGPMKGLQMYGQIPGRTNPKTCFCSGKSTKMVSGRSARLDRAR